MPKISNKQQQRVVFFCIFLSDQEEKLLKMHPRLAGETETVET